MTKKKQAQVKKARCLITETDQGVKIDLKHFYSRDHAMFVLSQAMGLLASEGASKAEVAQEANPNQTVIDEFLEPEATE